MMPRYIDAELFDCISWKGIPEGYDDTFDSGVLYVADLIDDAPTVSDDEIRGVVHCRECELWNEWDSVGSESLGNLVCSCAHWTVEDGVVFRTRPTDFCSYAERKEEA